MRVIGLLNWFDEEPAWLAACVSSMAKLCDHVVAVDGAFGLFPTTEHRSSPRQAETILRTADGLGIGCTLYIPKEKWWQGEVAKRALSCALALQVAEPEDWVLVLDADEVLSDIWSGTRTQLAETDLDVAEIYRTDAWGGKVSGRRLYRCLPELTYEQTHYTVTARKDGRKIVLSGHPEVHTNIVPSLLLSDVRYVDRGEERDPDRKLAKRDYHARAMEIENRALAPIGTLEMVG